MASTVWAAPTGLLHQLGWSPQPETGATQRYRLGIRGGFREVAGGTVWGGGRAAAAPTHRPDVMAAEVVHALDSLGRTNGVAAPRGSPQLE